MLSPGAAAKQNCRQSLAPTSPSRGLCLPPAILIQKGATLRKQFPSEENTTWKKQHIPRIFFFEIRSKEDAAQRGQLTGLSRGGFLVCKLKKTAS